MQAPLPHWNWSGPHVAPKSEDQALELFIIEIGYKSGIRIAVLVVVGRVVVVEVDSG